MENFAAGFVVGIIVLIVIENILNYTPEGWEDSEGYHNGKQAVTCKWCHKLPDIKYLGFNKWNVKHSCIGVISMSNHKSLAEAIAAWNLSQSNKSGN